MPAKRSPQKTRKAPENPGPAAIRSIFEDRGIPINNEQVRKFWTFHRLLRRENKRLDLTRLHSFTSIVERHYLDCALVARLISLPSPLLDLGTGAGFPGIPLKIMQPELRLLLAEGRARRVEFLRQACRALGFTDVTIVPHRITPRFRQQVTGVISRAVGSIGDILRRTEGCLTEGGQIIFMKGPKLTEELAQLRPSDSVELIQVRSYTIPKTSHHRTVAVFRKRSPMLKITEIQSRQNDRLKRLRSLLTARGIRKEGAALFAGRKIVPDLIAGYADRIVECAVRGSSPPPENLPARVPLLSIKPQLFDDIDPAGTRGPLLVARVDPTFPAWEPARATGMSLLLGLQDPVNLGAAIRLGAAFGVSAVVLLEEAANPYLPRSLRAGGPAVLPAPFHAGPSMGALQVGSLPLVALDPDGEPLPRYRFPQRCALLVGQEGPGLPDNLRGAAHVAIPTAPGVESLNAVTALAVALYAYRLQFPASARNGSPLLSDLGPHTTRT